MTSANRHIPFDPDCPVASTEDAPGPDNSRNGREAPHVVSLFQA